MKGGLRKSRPNQQRALDYITMSLEEIKNFHAIFFRETAAKNHNVFMWTIDKYLHDAEKIMYELGYTLHARMVWDKGNGIAPAFTVRFTHEYLLWFYPRGHMYKPNANVRGKYTTVLREKATIHSKKPDAAYEMLEAMFPEANKVELFARNIRAGWTSFGDELPTDRISTTST